MAWKPVASPTLTGDHVKKFYKLIEKQNNQKVSKKDKEKIKNLVQSVLEKSNL
jgi:hypothetical protein